MGNGDLSLIHLVELPWRGDDRGALVAIESGINVPFDIKRAYYIFGTKEGVSRGFHAHRSLTQLMVCVSGHCRIVLDNGFVREEVVLDNPAQGLLVSDMVWREMHELSQGCVLLVFASGHYDEADYIRNYDEFLLEVT